MKGRASNTRRHTNAKQRVSPLLTLLIPVANKHNVRIKTGKLFTNKILTTINTIYNTNVIKCKHLISSKTNNL